MRAAQSEHPDRFVLLDLDDTEASARAVPEALATGADDLVVRAGTVYLPRLVKAVPGDGTPPDLARGTVLVTGGATGAGAVLARHLVTVHGVRHLLVTGAAPAADAPTATGTTPTGPPAPTARVCSAGSASSARRSPSAPSTRPTGTRSPPSSPRSPPTGR
ncbi:hypothetical protein HFP43_19795 [Streptomyces sp. SJ1-7]|nr:hypothetical protein [Streptomyces sp. SJ1-7]